MNVWQRTIPMFFAVMPIMVCTLATAVAQSAAPPASTIKRIQISPVWGGSHAQDQAFINIRNVKGVFKRSWNPTAVAAENNVFRIIASDSDSPPEAQRKVEPHRLSEDTVSPDAVLALVRALSAPEMPTPVLSNLGITRTWLEQRASEEGKRVGALGEPNDERQQKFFHDSFTDLTLVKRLLPRVVGATWTGDGVWVHFVVEFANGHIWTAETTSLTAFTLPWTCKADGKTTRTFNADISRAVARLLPEGAVNRDRLAGKGLEDQIHFQVEGAIKQRWQQIGAEDIAGEALALLREKYTIRRTEVSDHIGLHFGPDQYIDGTREKSLQADVRLDSFPENLTVATVFQLENGKAIGLDDFLRNGSQYERLVLENPWVMASLRSHSDLGAWLVFVKDASMSDKAMRIFAADMHALGRDDLTQEVSAHRYEVADLSYYGNELILFPDHHAIVWRWDPSRDVFAWPGSALKTQECSDYNTLNQGCVAAEVELDGSLKH
jgi:hypothetical protein